MSGSTGGNSPGQAWPRRWPLVAGGAACALFGALMALAVISLWQITIPVTGTLKGEMMHRKTQAMSRITDALVRGDMRRVEAAAQHMWDIGESLNWYSSSELYEANDERFQAATASLFEAAQKSDRQQALEAALQLERSCIECHALINLQAVSLSLHRGQVLGYFSAQSRFK